MLGTIKNYRGYQTKATSRNSNTKCTGVKNTNVDGNYNTAAVTDYRDSQDILKVHQNPTQGLIVLNISRGKDAAKIFEKLVKDFIDPLDI